MGSCLLLNLIAAMSTSLATLHANETPAERDARMHWWREAKFGLAKAGVNQLELKPHEPQWKGFELTDVTLTPVR